MSVFKSLSNLEKTVEKCLISLQNDEDKLVFKLYCKHGEKYEDVYLKSLYSLNLTISSIFTVSFLILGIVKTHNLSFIESETLQAVFSKDTSASKLSSHYKYMCTLLVLYGLCKT